MILFGGSLFLLQDTPGTRLSPLAINDKPYLRFANVLSARGAGAGRRGPKTLWAQRSIMTRGAIWILSLAMSGSLM